MNDQTYSFMQTFCSRYSGAAIKQWIWSNRAVFVGLPLCFSSAASLNIAPLPQPAKTVNQDSLTQIPVTPPPSLAWDLTVAPASSSQAMPISAAPATGKGSEIGANSTASKPLSTQTPSPKTPATGSPSLSLTPTITPPENLPSIPVRIGLVRRAPKLQLSTSESTFIMDAAGQPIAELSENIAVSIEPGASGLNIGSLQLPPDIWIKPNPDGFVAINGRWYRGSVQILQDRQRLVAVNHLDLETYLYSVVGAEMSPSWPIEALKAQAIAARSYALARISGNPASPHYDLGDTPRWQAYPGIKTEADRTHLAVNNTKGLLISHKGAVVESLYASTLHLVRKVHKGYGMSQNGARDLAQQQLDYQQILNHFYPGTTLTWLQAS